MLSSPGQQPVRLNVGGIVYSTRSETLSRFPDSMLGAMFRGPLPSSSRDQQGNLFIDRDGKTFRHILNYLRSCHLDLPEDYKEMQLLRREADFYQIQPLLEELSTKQQGQAQALLQCIVQSQSQTLHFNQKVGPLNYTLSSCSLAVHRAHIFCTCPAFLSLLVSRVGYGGTPGTPPTNLHLELTWSPRPPGLPEAEYARHGFRRLLARPAGRELADGPAFVEEVLRLALDQRFRVDSLLPDPVDILRCTALRFVRY